MNKSLKLQTFKTDAHRREYNIYCSTYLIQGLWEEWEKKIMQYTWSN